MIHRQLLAVIISVSLSNCSAVEPVEQALVAVTCDADSAKSLVAEIIQGEAIKEAKKQIDGPESITELDDKLSAAASRLNLKVRDIRTEKIDPNSNKRLCIGTLVAVIPTSMTSDADEASRLLGIGAATEALLASGFEKQADTLVREVSFSVQPTDAGDKIFAEIEGLESSFSALGDVISSFVMYPELKLQSEQAISEQRARSEELASQIIKQRDADLRLASAENKVANQEIGQIWIELSPMLQSKLIEIQRAWIDKKTVDCNISAAGKSDDLLMKETERLRCDTEVTRERSKELRSILAQ